MEIKWQKPKYSYEAKLPLLPLESEIDLLIHKMPRKISVVLQLIKETGARIGEALRLKWIDVDFQRNLITINSPEKHGKTRIFKVSKELIQRINMLPKKTHYVFCSKEETTEASLKISLTSNFFKKRKRLAFEYQNPRLSQIGFHTIRHWKATLEYHKTKDILHVKEMLGHASIDNTLIYITLEKALFGSDNEAEFHSATAQTASEAAKLIEVGFDYVCTTPEGIMLFRKRK